MAQDEHPRPQTTLEQMAKLPTVFKKGGTVTAANASVSTRVRTMLDVKYQVTFVNATVMCSLSLNVRPCS